jgi:hypothetical protein
MTSNSIYSKQTYSYLALRKSIGWIGILLPLVLTTGAYILFEDPVIQASISHYYHTEMGDVFVGALCAVALFLFFYVGHDLYDNTVATIAGTFALGVAWFPVTNHGEATGSGIIHLISAASLFLILAYFSYFIFTKGSDNPTPEKLIRNKIYRRCGIIIAACIVGILVYKIASDAESSFVFWAETVALVTFGFSWLTKGEAIYADNKMNPVESFFARFIV